MTCTFSFFLSSSNYHQLYSFLPSLSLSLYLSLSLSFSFFFFFFLLSFLLFSFFCFLSFSYSFLFFSIFYFLSFSFFFHYYQLRLGAAECLELLILSAAGNLDVKNEMNMLPAHLARLTRHCHSYRLYDAILACVICITLCYSTVTFIVCVNLFVTSARRRLSSSQ